MKKNILVLLSIVSLFIISCSNFVNSAVEKNPASTELYCTVRGFLSSEFDYSASSRSAFPANADIDLSSYTTRIYYKESRTATQKTLCCTTTDSTFELKLPSLGTFYLEAESYTTSNPLSNIEFKTLQPVEITLTESAPYKNDVSLFLHYFIEESDATGSIELYFRSFDITKVKYFEIFEEGNPDFFNYNEFSNALSLYKLNNVTSGVHNYIFKFYDAEYDQLLYQCNETISIFPNKTTNTWVNNGNAEYFSQENIGENSVLVMNITQDCLDNFSFTNFYVDSSVSESGNGSYFAPVKTVEEAVNKCVDSSKDYTINIKETVTASSGITISNNITIQKAADASSAKISYTSTTASLFTVSPSMILKISNVNIEGPNQETTSAGPAVYNNGTLILNNVTFSKFKGTNTSSGGCLHNEGNGTISITGGKITECEGKRGGAIYNNGKDIDINGCTINTCKANTYGGAIFNNTNSTIYLTGSTLLGVNTTTKATNSSYGNYATTSGGAIYLQNGTLYMYDNTIIGKNYAAGNGGGIYMGSTAKVYLQDSASIKSCAAASGSGIYTAAAASKIYIKDSAYLDSASDIRLCGNGYVTLNGNLTPPGSASGITATLTPQFYSPDEDPSLGSYIKLLAEDSSGLIAQNHSKFAVTPQASDPAVGWSITSEGKLSVKISTCSSKPSGMTDFTITDIEDLNKIMGSDWTVSSGETYTLSGNLTANTNTKNNTFAAVFDGAGYTISGLKNSFVTTLSGTIKNLTLEGTSSTAGFATSVTNAGKIENCTNKVVVTYSSSTAAANIGGFTQSNAGTITGCTNTAKITYSSSKDASYRVGGIAGVTTGGTITNCINTGDIIGNSTVSGNWACPGGGIAGDVSNSSATIKNCKNTGNISNFSVAGGIVGQSKGKIQNCYNRATSIRGINSNSYVSGICGGSGDSAYAPTINNCYSTTAITSTTKKAAILGSSSGTVEYCYYLNYTGAVAQANKTDGDTVDSFSFDGTDCTLNNKSLNINGNTSQNVYSLLMNWVVQKITAGDYSYYNWNNSSDGYPVFTFE